MTDMTQATGQGTGATARQAQRMSGARTAASASSGGKGTSVWPGRAPHGGIEGTAALELALGMGGGGEPGLLGALLEMVGAEHVMLGQTLAAWQREQDRLANRAWRRPGGLARPAGL